MKTNNVTDPDLDILATLSPAEPSRTCDERIRSRCHRALARRRPLPRHAGRSSNRVERLLNPALAVTAAIYAAAALLEGLRLLIPIPNP